METFLLQAAESDFFICYLSLGFFGDISYWVAELNAALFFLIEDENNNCCRRGAGTLIYNWYVRDFFFEWT